jgi:membrane-associated phospholipid phosphatase
MGSHQWITGWESIRPLPPAEGGGESHKKQGGQMNTFGYPAIEWVVWIQNLGAWLELPMRFFTFLGSEEFFLLILPALYWSIDTALGLQIGLILLFNSWLNGLFKLIFAAPRPYWVSLEVKALAAESSFGIPSGHAQIAIGVWGALAARLRKRWVWGIAALVIFFIGFSRLYLGVHFVHDVLVGWLLGGLTLWAFLALWNNLSAWAKSLSLGQQIVSAFVLSLIFLLFGWVAVNALRGYTLPVEWIENARRAGDPLPDPVSLAGFITSAGTLFGLLGGLAWIASRGGYRAEGPLARRILRYALGLIGLILLYFGLSLIAPRGSDLAAVLFRYVRYAMVGFWISGGAPWLFLHFKMVKSPKS